ncbi:MAG: DNA topoisomerase [Candidatus Baldrarchaeia archaeon]
MRRVLVVSEKYKQALAIAKVAGSSISKKEYYDIPVLIARGKTREYIVVPLQGHLTEYSTIEEFSRWEDVDPRLIIEKPDALTKVYRDTRYVKMLSHFAKICDELILATDADEEGENIALEAYEIIKRVNPRLHPKRLWLHTLVPSDIRRAFNNLIEPKWNWALAVEARRQIDAMIGFAATRELTLAHKDLLKFMDSKVISVGRVQTPTLYLIYQREKERREFKPEPYWNMIAQIPLTEGKILKARHEGSPFRDKSKVDKIFKRVRIAKYARIVDVKIEDREIEPPIPFNTTDALKTITNILPITAERAMQILEDLYLDTLISYPRTDTNKFSPDFDHVPYISKFKGHSEYGKFADQILRMGWLRPKQGTIWKGDHEPIMPVDSAERHDPRFRTENHWRAYDIIVRRYLALFMPPAVETRMRILLDINGEPFIAEVLTLKEEGFLKVWTWARKNYDPPIPLRRVKGDVIPVSRVYVEEKKTQPPPHFTESSLIAEMEKLNLGTKCLTGDTSVNIISNGGHLIEMPIEEIFGLGKPVGRLDDGTELREVPGDMRVISLNEDDGKVCIRNVKYVSRRKLLPEESLVRIDTPAGSFIATEDHLVYSEIMGTITPVPAGKISPGDRIVCISPKVIGIGKDPIINGGDGHKLSNGIFTVPVLSVRRVEASPDIYVYDLSVSDDAPNFTVSSFILVHNSTRPQHIETNKKRGYVVRKGKSLVITPIGEALITNLEKIWKEFLLPDFTAKIERKLQEVMDGRVRWTEIVEETRREFLEMFDKLRSRIRSIREHIGKAVMELRKEQLERNTLAACPKCGSPMILHHARSGKRYIKCISCGETRPLPRTGSIRRLSTIKCEICGNFVLSIRKKNLTYRICPICWVEVGLCSKCSRTRCKAKKS